MIDYTRGIDIFNPDNFNQSILIIGAGGIGSTTAYALAKMGIESITVRDGDTVENHNCSSQFYSPTQVALSKTQALQDNILQLTGTKIKTINSFFDHTDSNHVEVLQSYNIVILALDSIDTRHNVISSTADHQFIIDPRMVKQLSIVYTLSGLQREERTNTHLNSTSSSPEETRCTERAVAFNALAMAGLIGAIISKYAKNQTIKESYQLDLEYDQYLTF